MPVCALLIDFGSTYTKLRAIDLAQRRVLGAGQGPSTVTSDVTVGMKVALADLERRLGVLPNFKYRLASSSAAGGLRMVTVGLVRELTAEAACRAALGAGAKLVGSFAYRLTASDLTAIIGLCPDILLLAGGTDGGNEEVIRYNANILARSALDCPIVYAGNRSVAEEAAAVLAAKTVIATDNVMPEFNVLNIEPARGVIRKIFIDRIVHAKGIDRAQAMFDRVLMPTPAAVMEGAQLIADGCAGAEGLGELMVIDPGGATTDVHSIANGDPAAPGVILHGLPEPRVKRTVEGDLGMRHNIRTIVDVAGLAQIASDACLSESVCAGLLNKFATEVERVPQSRQESAFDLSLASAAIKIAVSRHCGRVETAYTATGAATIQHGKDLTSIATVIGTGGPFAHGNDPRALLRASLADPSDPLSLRPTAPRLLLDKDYLLYACGLLAAVEPEAALELALKYLQPVESGVPIRQPW